MEDYLESILELEEANNHARVKDIARKMHVTLPTVTSMLNTLRKRNLVNHGKYEYVKLTRKGRLIARDIYRRHTILKRFLTDILHIDTKTADTDACRMEHAVSADTLERIVKFMEFIETCPRGGADWLKNFEHYHNHGPSEANCLERMKDFEKHYRTKIKKLEDKLK